MTIRVRFGSHWPNMTEAEIDSEIETIKRVRAEDNSPPLDEAHMRDRLRRNLPGEWITDPGIYRLLDGIMAEVAERHIAKGETPPWYARKVKGYPYPPGARATGSRRELGELD